MTLQEVQKQVDDWIKENGVRYFNELTNTVLLTEEIGEFSRLMARIYGEQSFKNKEDEENAKEHVKDEIADILFVLVCLANQMEIDLEDIFRRNIQKKTERDSTRHKENPKLNN